MKRIAWTHAVAGRLLAAAIGLTLAACQPEAAPTPTAAATPRAAALPGQLFFDGFDMTGTRSGWAWKGLSQLYRTDDGGLSWTEIHLQGRRQVVGADFLSAQEAWLPGVPDKDAAQIIYHTTDGGKTWQERGSLRGPNIELHFLDGKAGWALNGSGAAGNVYYQAWHTLDGGLSWTPLEASPRPGEQPGPIPNTLHVETGDAVSFTPPQTIWITSGHGDTLLYAGLTVSRDDGKSWKSINPPLPADYLRDQPAVSAAAPQFVSGQDAYLPVTVGRRLVFFASHDGGGSWNLLPGALPSGPMLPRVQFVSAEDGFAVCGLNLCSTRNAMQSWQAIPTPFRFDPYAGGTTVSQFDFVDRDHGWAILADPDGTGSFLGTSDGGRTWIDLKPRAGF